MFKQRPTAPAALRSEDSLRRAVAGVASSSPEKAPRRNTEISRNQITVAGLSVTASIEFSTSSGLLRVVGESHYQENLRKARAMSPDPEPVFWASLIPEPDNPYDPTRSKSPSIRSVPSGIRHDAPRRQVGTILHLLLGEVGDTPEPTAFDEPGAGSVALVALFRQGLRPRVSPERVAFWRWIDVRCRSLNELRALLTMSELERHVVRLHFDMAVSVAEESEVERIVRELQGTDAHTAAPGSSSLIAQVCGWSLGLLMRFPNTYRLQSKRRSTSCMASCPPATTTTRKRSPHAHSHIYISFCRQPTMRWDGCHETATTSGDRLREYLFSRRGVANRRSTSVLMKSVLFCPWTIPVQLQYWRSAKTPECNNVQQESR